MNPLQEHMTNQLESNVRALSRALYNERRAFLFKVPEEMSQTPCDFFGWSPAGRAIAIECKQVNRPSLPIGTSNGLQAHQWNALELAHHCGGIAILIWQRGLDVAVLRFDYLAALAEGRKSIQWPPLDHFATSWEDRLRALLTL